MKNMRADALHEEAVRRCVVDLKEWGASVAVATWGRLPNLLLTDGEVLRAIALNVQTRRGTRESWRTKETATQLRERYEHLGLVDVVNFRAIPTEAEARAGALHDAAEQALREKWRVVVPGRSRPDIVAVMRRRIMAVDVMAGAMDASFRSRLRFKRASFEPRWGRFVAYQHHEGRLVRVVE